ncbi:MAG: hypothetical protein IKL20_02645 [Alistipes sp.]|nr:hypothetical protein [Alistipes sp.]
MYRYTHKQKYAIAYILMQIIEADTIIHDREIEYMNSILKQLAFTTQDIEYLENLELSYCMDIVKDMQQEQKNEVIEMFRTMISIDGRIDPREVAVIENL